MQRCIHVCVLHQNLFPVAHFFVLVRKYRKAIQRIEKPLMFTTLKLEMISQFISIIIIQYSKIPKYKYFSIRVNFGDGGYNVSKYFY